jgi:hypothetical protein
VSSSGGQNGPASKRTSWKSRKSPRSRHQGRQAKSHGPLVPFLHHQRLRCSSVRLNCETATAWAALSVGASATPRNGARCRRIDTRQEWLHRGDVGAHDFGHEVAAGLPEFTERHARAFGERTTRALRHSGGPLSLSARSGASKLNPRLSFEDCRVRHPAKGPAEPGVGARAECAWLLNAGYIDGYTGKRPF